GELGNAVTDFTVYAGCWMLGFAHQQGLLREIYGASAGGVMWVAPVLAAVTGICRLLLRRAERGGPTGARSAAGDVPR
ncbi:hypothetical protein ACWEP3_22625, partial [Streptomyces albidoflavus]